MAPPMGYYYPYPMMGGPPPPPPSSGEPAPPGGFYMDPSAMYGVVPPPYYGMPPPYYAGAPASPPRAEAPVAAAAVAPLAAAPVSEERDTSTRPMIATAVSRNPSTMIRLKNRPPVEITTETTTVNPLKEELTKALNDATKEMDKVKHNAVLSLSTFDNLDWKPTVDKPLERMSLSDGTVPIDNHILNWRDLVGLPSSSSPFSEDAKPTGLGDTPLLATGTI